MKLTEARDHFDKMQTTFHPKAYVAKFGKYWYLLVGDDSDDYGTTGLPMDTRQALVDVMPARIREYYGLEEPTGAGLFDLRSLSTETAATLYDAVIVGPEAETRLASFLRRILIERGAL